METEDTSSSSVAAEEKTIECSSIHDEKPIAKTNEDLASKNSEDHQSTGNVTSELVTSEASKNAEDSIVLDPPALAKNLLVADVKSKGLDNSEVFSDDFVLKWEDDDDSNTTDMNKSTESKDSGDGKAINDPILDVSDVTGKTVKETEVLSKDESITSIPVVMTLPAVALSISDVINKGETQLESIVNDEKDLKTDKKHEAEQEMSLDDVIESLDREIRDVDKDVTKTKKEEDKKKNAESSSTEESNKKINEESLSEVESDLIETVNSEKEINKEEDQHHDKISVEESIKVTSENESQKENLMDIEIGSEDMFPNYKPSYIKSKNVEEASNTIQIEEESNKTVAEDKENVESEMPSKKHTLDISQSEDCTFEMDLPTATVEERDPEIIVEDAINDPKKLHSLEAEATTIEKMDISTEENLTSTNIQAIKNVNEEITTMEENSALSTDNHDNPSESNVSKADLETEKTKDQVSTIETKLTEAEYTLKADATTNNVSESPENNSENILLEDKDSAVPTTEVSTEILPQTSSPKQVEPDLSEKGKEEEITEKLESTLVISTANASTLDSNIVVPEKEKEITENVELTPDISIVSATTSDLETTTPNISKEVQDKDKNATDIVELTPEITIESVTTADSNNLAPNIPEEVFEKDKEISENRELTAEIVTENASTSAPNQITAETSIEKEITDPTKPTKKIEAENVSTAVSSGIIPKTASPDKEKDLTDAKPTTEIAADTVSTEMAADISDEVPEFTDSLGLLEATFRTIEDQDPEEDEPDPDDDEEGEDEEDFDQDDESNPTPMEHSEDSNNAQSSETDQPKEAVIEATDSTTEAIEEATEKAIEAISPKDDEDVAQDKDKVPSIDEMPVSEIEGAQKETDIQTPVETESSKGELDTDILKNMLEKEKSKSQTLESPSKSKKLEISKANVFMNYIDLEETSSEDDVQEVKKTTETEDIKEKTEVPEKDGVTISLPKEIEVMSNSLSSTSDILSKNGEVAITGVPKPAVAKVARLNTDEISIKTANVTEPLVIPETKMDAESMSKAVSELNQEIFNLDSDEEKEKEKSPKSKKSAPKDHLRCVNPLCDSDHDSSTRIVADPTVLRFYEVKKKKQGIVVCVQCANDVALRMQNLLEGVKSLKPLLELNLEKSVEELVEISDSETDSEPEESERQVIGTDRAKFLEDELENMINSAWKKYNLEERLQTAKDELNNEVERLEKESKEIDAMLDECQKETDQVRKEFYAAFARKTSSLPPFIIVDTPQMKYAFTKEDDNDDSTQTSNVRSSKRNRMSTEEPPAKRVVPPTKDDKNNQSNTSVDSKDDDNVDVKVVKLSAEAAPSGLPPAGDLQRPPLKYGDAVLAARQANTNWVRAEVQFVIQKTSGPNSFTQCRIKFMHKVKAQIKCVSARQIAYFEPANVRLTIGTRIIALFKDQTNTQKKEVFYPGVVAEVPNPVNSYRYLVFFDDGYAQYVTHNNTRAVCESASPVWEEVPPAAREFVRTYLLAYPERPMVRLHASQRLNTEWNGKWWHSTVLQVDASLVNVHFEADNRTEWIYRGSTRLAPLYLELQAAERHRSRALPRSTGNKNARGLNMPYVEYTRSDETNKDLEKEKRDIEEEIKRQRAVAKKSTATPPPPAADAAVMSRVVYYTPKAAVKPHKMSPHSCSTRCRRTDVLPLKELRTYNPLARPLLSGWERQIVRFRFRREIMYRAPCGRRIRSPNELLRYLQLIQSDMSLDLFDFNVNTHCLAEFVLNRCLVSKKDLSHGKENVPVPCVNYYDTSLPEFCSYNTERTPTAGVPLNLDPEFLCGCDCTDDCQDKSRCACWRLTLEGARTIGLDDDVGYQYKRLLEPVPSGIYECNSRCKCRHTCLNRVAQHPLQLKLQVFKTQNRGWGIRALNDVPKGAFLCVYAGNLLTDATANLDGLNEGDEYLAELDYIEVVEQMKEGYEADIPGGDKELDRKETSKETSETSSESEDDDAPSRNEEMDGDFKPDFEPGVATFNKRLRRRDKKKEEEERQKQKEKEKKDDDCITISDDEELREPSNFMAQAGMGGKQFVSKYRSVRSHFGKDEACYIMDAKVQGNIGRYLNHSCTPNVFVQNVFVDTHDPRFPWVAFFALAHVKAGTELTWNYNYDIGSVPSKVLYCYCGAPNCRGRLL